MALESGKYSIACKAKIGNIEGTMDAVVSGNTFTGELAVMGGTQPISDGVIDGDSFTCGVKIKTPLGMKDTKVAGTIVDGNITGTLTIKMIGELKFTGAKM